MTLGKRRPRTSMTVRGECFASLKKKREAGEGFMSFQRHRAMGPGGGLDYLRERVKQGIA